MNLSPPTAIGAGAVGMGGMTDKANQAAVDATTTVVNQKKAGDAAVYYSARS